MQIFAVASPQTPLARFTSSALLDCAEAPLDIVDVYDGSTDPASLPNDLQGAIHNLRSAQSKPYYDDKADAGAVAKYYGDLAPGDDGKVFFRSLSKLVKSTHTEVLSYEPSLYLYPWVDLRPDLSLQSIYSSKAMNATQAILNDYGKAKYWNSLGQMAATAALSPERAGAQMAITANNHLLNCEHVVCQSWFDYEQPMKGDLHHLFSCDPQSNSYRGNRPLAVVESPESTMPDAGALGDGTFQPEGGKGPAARASLYFFLRYPKKISEYKPEDLETLLKWNRDDPPGLYEKHRNQAIQELQGNRNPFVDHPEWAEKVDFKLGIKLHPKAGEEESSDAPLF